MAGEGDHVGHGELPHDLPGAHRVGKRPLQERRTVVVVLQPPAGVADAPTAAPLPRDRTGGARPGGRMPTAQSVRDGRLVGRRPVAHRGGGQQIAETAVEGHRGDDHGSRRTGAVREVRERVEVGLDLGRHIDVRDPGAQRRLDQRSGGRGEGPRAVDHGVRSGQGTVERGGVVDRRRPDLQSGCGRGRGCRCRRRSQLLGVAAGEDRNEPALPQLCHHEASGVAVRAVHRHRPPRPRRRSRRRSRSRCRCRYRYRYRC